jgi:hypothetical protein
MINFKAKDIYRFAPLIFLLSLLLSLLFANNIWGGFYVENQQFSELANSFLHAKLYFLEGSPCNNYRTDNAIFNNHYFWPLGPLPALILMPFVGLFQFFELYFRQGYLNFFLVLSIFYLISKIARQLKFSAIDSVYLAIAFVFGSMFAGVIINSASSYFAHTITVLLLFLALQEYFGRKRYLLIGLIFGLILLTRVTAFLAIVFFVLDFLMEKDIKWKTKVKNIIKISLIPTFCLILLFAYNYARFSDPLDQGYNSQVLPKVLMEDRDNYGLFNLKYLPRNAYYSLINLPKPVYNTDSRLLNYPYVKAERWGLSIFMTSPYLLYLFFAKIKNKKTQLLLATSTFVWLVIASSFFIGYVQFGFRYALDFMPLLFTAFMITYQENREKMSIGLKTVIMLSTIINIYLLLNL